MILLPSDPVFFIIALIVRVVGAIECFYKARELRRSTLGWGLFGFATPFIAMILVHWIRPGDVKENASDDLDINSTI